MQQVGTKIQMFRKHKNITQAQLAEVLAVSPQSVSKWENLQSLPDISLLPVIARYFGITMDELFGYRLDALNYKERFIRFMADNGVLQFGAYPLQSGRVSPYYINTGNYQSASQITKLGEFYAECIREHNVDGNLLVSNTRQEIPVVIATSMVLYQKYGMDMDYSADGNVGKTLESGDRVILIKDTLTSGQSLHEALSNLQNHGIQRVTDVIVSVDRMERAQHSPHTALRDLEMRHKVKIHAIVTVEDIIRAMKNGIVGSEEHLQAMEIYRRTYGGIGYGD
ncbi:MAG: helix-turn-helix domain-containing protein [Clostridiales bacterium]|nr:helix-turn-helix domain-containing protein [Clostridiales bacterium]